jgi:pimeloyl-ACP methyl ester carboxylesterase
MFTFSEARQQPTINVGLEAQILGRLETAYMGNGMGKGFVLEREFETIFYSSNNLPEQLKHLFGTLNPRRLDEDLLERSCIAADRLLRGASLLDNAIQKIALALKNAGLIQDGHLRREWDSPTLPLCFEFSLETNPHQALFALKRLWAADWSFEATLERLDNTGHYGLEARPVLFFAGGKPRLDPHINLEITGLLGLPEVQVLSSEGKLVGIRKNSAP